MTTFLALIQTLSVAVLAAAFAAIALAVFRFLTDVGRVGLLVRVAYDPRTTGPTNLPKTPGKGYAVYLWSGGAWILETDFTQPGYETTPPARPGSYEGQLLKKEAVPR